MVTIVVVDGKSQLSTLVREALAECDDAIVVKDVSGAADECESAQGIRSGLDSEIVDSVLLDRLPQSDDFDATLEQFRRTREPGRSVLFGEEEVVSLRIYLKKFLFDESVHRPDYQPHKWHWVTLNTLPGRPPRQLRHGRSK